MLHSGFGLLALFKSDSMLIASVGVVYIWHRSDSSIISHQECYWSLHYCRLLSLEWRNLSSTTHQQPLLMTVRPQVSQTMIVTVATLFILSFGASTALANEPGLCRFHYTGSAIIHAPIAISSGGIMSYLIFYISNIYLIFYIIINRPRTGLMNDRFLTIPLRCI